MSDGTQRVTLNVSLYPRHVQAVRQTAHEIGSVSAAAGVRLLIEEAMRARRGDNWAETLDRDKAEAGAETASAA